MTFGIANYRGNALTTGSFPNPLHKKTEILDMTTMTWSDADDYPFASKWVKKNSLKQFRQINCKRMCWDQPGGAALVNANPFLVKKLNFWIQYRCLLFCYSNFFCSLYHWWSIYTKCYCGVQRRSMATASELISRTCLSWCNNNRRSNVDYWWKGQFRSRLSRDHENWNLGAWPRKSPHPKYHRHRDKSTQQSLYLWNSTIWSWCQFLQKRNR